VQFETLALAALAWISLNALAGSSRVRQLLVARFGEKARDHGLSLTQMAALWWLVREYGRAPYVALWRAGPTLKLVPLVLVPLAFVLLAVALLAPHDSQASLEEPADGWARITRSPFHGAVALWGASHQIVSGDVGSQLFFGALALAAFWRIYAVRRESLGISLRTRTQDTTGLRGRSDRARSRLRELGLPILLGFGLAVAAAVLHSRIFGTAVLPNEAHLRAP